MHRSRRSWCRCVPSAPSDSCSDSCSDPDFGGPSCAAPFPGMAHEGGLKASRKEGRKKGPGAAAMEGAGVGTGVEVEEHRRLASGGAWGRIRQLVFDEVQNIHKHTHIQSNSKMEAIGANFNNRYKGEAFIDNSYFLFRSE